MSADPTGQIEGGSADAAQQRMGFLDHLDELRRRVFWTAAVLMAFVAGSYAFSDWILAFLLNPIQEATGTLAVIRPAEAFMNKIKASFVAGVFLTIPVAIYQVWSFIAPGLYKHERKWVIPIITVGSLLFLGGAAFCYTVALPAAIGFLADQGKQFNNQITVDYAFSFATKLLLGLGFVFELPLVMLALGRMGLVTSKFLIKKLDIAIFVCFLVAAILTPTPDMLTMTVFALPMVALYLIGIGIVHVVQRPRKDADGE